MSDPSTFTVRPLAPSTALDGAFRVHIPPKDLDVLGLKSGDLCQLSSADGNAGVGIAWRSTETTAKPQPHPVKLSETLRDIFGFKLGYQIKVQKLNTKVAHADRVVIVDKTNKHDIDASKDDDSWFVRCSFTLINAEAIASGTIFEVASRKGMKRRFLIEQIESSAKGENTLYSVNDATELVLQDEESPPAVAPYVSRSLEITTEGIGGLHKQIELLNKRLSRLIGKFRGRELPRQIQRNGGILLYGPNGTGKSLLLNRVAQAPWRKTITIDQGVLGATLSKSSQTLRALFDEAIANQPSLILLDNLETIAGAGQRDSYGSLTSILTAEFDKLKETRVLVIAATQSLGDIDKSLRTPGRFRYEIEVPIPDMQARIEILKALHGTSTKEDLTAESVGERTHGFVGQDLEALYNNALERAADRFCDALEDDDNASISNGLTFLNISDDDNDEITLAGNHSASYYARIDTTIDDYEKALLDVRPTAMKEVFLEKPNVRWSDVGGSRDVKQVLDEVVEWPFKYTATTKWLGLESQKGILFYGPPGCSKTMTAKAIATSSGLNFIAVKGAELTSMYVGESERAVREVFRKARAAAPSIIFFDEIDSIGSERDSSGTKGLNVLTTLLNEMDGIETLKGVLVLAATNKPEILDPALLRPGRFDSLIYIAPPNEAARKEILRIRTRSVPLADDVDLDALARDTEGYSGAEIVNICLGAGRATMRRYVNSSTDDGGAGGDVDAQPRVSKEDFEVTLRQTVRRITPEMTEAYEDWKNGVSKGA